MYSCDQNWIVSIITPVFWLNPNVVGSSLRSGRDCVGGGWMYSPLSTFNTMTRCPWASHRTPTSLRAPQHKSLPIAPGVCSRCVCVRSRCVCVCVCALWMGKCRARIPTMGHHTWLYVTFTSSVSHDPLEIILICWCGSYYYQCWKHLCCIFHFNIFWTMILISEFFNESKVQNNSIYMK